MPRRTNAFYNQAILDDGHPSGLGPILVTGVGRKCSCISLQDGAPLGTNYLESFVRGGVASALVTKLPDILGHFTYHGNTLICIDKAISVGSMPSIMAYNPYDSGALTISGTQLAAVTTLRMVSA